MSETWHPDALVDAQLARELLAEQFPSLAGRPVELVSTGWDYTVFRVDSDWAFRFPRREVVLEPMRRELAALPALAPLLPVPVPVPVHLGRPSERFPWPFYGAPWLQGEEATLAGHREALAAELGRFLRALHDARVSGLSTDANCRADMTRRVPLTRAALAALEERWAPAPGVERLLDAAEALPPAAATAVCHGDLHFRQLLVHGPRLTGVVDWVDVCLSDPGIDLMVVFAFLSPEQRPSFFAEYGDAAPESLLRARVLALNLSAVLARYGWMEKNDPVEREALASLDRAVADL